MKPNLLSALWLLSITTFLGSWAFAQSPAEILNHYGNTLLPPQTSSTFSASDGEKLYNLKGKQWSCATCHTTNPKNEGQHAATNRLIKPLAPTANPDRFTSLAKVEKWFTRNCNEVHGRECTTKEKGDFIQFMLSVK